MNILERCKSTIIDSNIFTNIQYIGITGSVGRGEKDIDDKDINDIDFVVIANSCDLSKKTTLDRELQEITGKKFTDILYLNQKKFIKKISSNSIEQYLFDFIMGNKKIYSLIDIDKYKKIKFKVSRISAIDVLMTRLWALICPFYFYDGIILPRQEYIKFSLYQLKKSLSAIIDAILIIEEKYSSPLKIDKEILLRQTEFYRINSSSIDALLSEDFLNFNSDIYRKIFTIYHEILTNLVGDKLHIFNFPHKKIIIKSLINKNSLAYIKSMQEKYHLMIDVASYFNGKKIDFRKFNNINDKLFFEVIHE